MRRDDAREAVASRAVADVVVILGENDEALGFQAPRRGAMAPVAKPRIFALVDKSGVHRPCQVLSGSVIEVVAEVLARHDRVQGVVEVVVPLRIEAKAARGGVGDEARVVVRALRDQLTGPPELVGE